MADHLHHAQGQVSAEAATDVREATRMLAALGGFLGRKGDGEPGTKTIWIGYTNLLLYLKAINQVAASG